MPIGNKRYLSGKSDRLTCIIHYNPEQCASIEKKKEKRTILTKIIILKHGQKFTYIQELIRAHTYVDVLICSWVLKSYDAYNPNCILVYRLRIRQRQ